MKTALESIKEKVQKAIKGSLSHVLFPNTETS